MNALSPIPPPHRTHKPSGVHSPAGSTRIHPHKGIPARALAESRPPAGVRPR